MTKYTRSLRIMTTIALISPLGLGGCAQHYSTPTQAAADSCRAFGPRAREGTVIGGLSGAAAGAAIGELAGHNGTAALIGAGLGAVTGMMAGSAIGHGFDQRDCAAAELALQSMGSAPVDAAVAWSDPDTGSHGSYTPTNVAYTDPKTGEICRPISASYYLHGHTPVVGDTGNVCRNPNGNWYMQKAST